MYKFGFIGSGNMGSALAKAICRKVGGKNVAVCDISSSKADSLAEETGSTAVCIETIATECEYIFIGVKPQALADMLGGVKEILKARESRFVLVSMAAGTPISRIESLIGFSCPIIRIMPNVAASAGAGMTLCTKNDKVTAKEFDFFIDSMSLTGAIDRIDEEKIDSYSIVTGCAPAWAAIVIEALADGQVAIGVPRDKAYLYAAKTLEGAAKLMLESGMIPAQLKDAVCSPGGTTVQGVKAMEAGAVRSSLIDAVIASYEKTLKM